MDVSPKPLDCSPTRPLSSQSEPEMAPLGTSCSELACGLPQEALLESRTIPFQVYEHPYVMGGEGAEAFPGNEGVCVCDVAAAQPHLSVDLKNQASLFFKLLLKNQWGTLYPFSEKPLLIPVGRRTSCEMRVAGRRHSRDLHPEDTGVEKG